VRIGVDIGGTKIAGALLDSAGRVVESQRVPAPQDYSASIQAVSDLVAHLRERADGPCRVGVATPGCISPDTGRMINAKNTPLQGRAFGHDLEAKLGPVRIANDANCFALSEAVDGAAEGAAIVVGVILGTGVGSGLVFDRRVIAGAGGTAGEWGHNPLPWPRPEEYESPACSCGKRGCIEAWLSGPGLARDHERVTGESLEPREIDQRAANGDAESLASLERYYDRLARALATLINVLDPHAIVLGGGASNLNDLAARAHERLAPWVFSDRVRATVVRNRHGDASGVRGAAWLWPSDEE
jgi:fructokinase